SIMPRRMSGRIVNCCCVPALDLDGRRAVITHVWTSSVDSALGARRNWGLPGQSACFDPPQRRHDRETCPVPLPGRAPLTLSFGSHGPKLPTRSDMLPRRWRTLVQPWKGHYYQTCIQARVMASAAWLDCCHVPSGSGLPDFSGQRTFMGLYADEFRLWFPRADITAINRRRNPHTDGGPAG